MGLIEYIQQNQVTTIWLAIAVVLFVVELIGPGVGLMFAGCGALTVAALLDFSVLLPEGEILQGVIFFAATALWTLVLWKPIQKFRVGQKKGAYSNMVGDIAIVGEKGLSKLHGGDVLWSGTIMNARLSENSTVENLKSGESVIIKEVTGNILVVAVK